jgi:hypothetical protein
LRYRNWIAPLILSLLVSVGAVAGQITGTVTNATTNKPSSGDEVVLLSLANGMDEVAKTKTDSQGHYSLNVPDEGAQHLVRVARQSVHYFKSAPPGTTTADISVYDAATQVEGLVTDARVFHLQASGGSMDVQESYILNNQSQPPRTKIGNQTFVVTLPDGAEMGEASLTGPSGMPITVAAVPSGTKNRYAYDFPIRPGQTRFEVTYKVPYNGAHEFSFKPEAPLSELGVLLPKSMKFNGVSGGFAQDMDEAGLAVFFAKNVPANQEVRFSVSGEGLIPTDVPGTNAGQPAGETGGATIPNPAGGTSGAWWFLGGAIVILIGGGAIVLWRKAVAGKAASNPKAAKAVSKARAQAQSQSVKPQQGDMLDVLKDELFQLETDLVNGKISQEEYEKSKAGLDTLFRRQMKRNNKTTK